MNKAIPRADPSSCTSSIHSFLCFLQPCTSGLPLLHTLWISATSYARRRSSGAFLQRGSPCRAEWKIFDKRDDQRSTRSMHGIGTRLIITTLLSYPTSVSPFMLPLQMPNRYCKINRQPTATRFSEYPSLECCPLIRESVQYGPSRAWQCLLHFPMGLELLGRCCYVRTHS